MGFLVNTVVLIDIFLSLTILHFFYFFCFFFPVETIHCNLRLFTNSRRRSASPCQPSLQRQSSCTSLCSQASCLDELTVSSITNGKLCLLLRIIQAGMSYLPQIMRPLIFFFFFLTIKYIRKFCFIFQLHSAYLIFMLRL